MKTIVFIMLAFTVSTVSFADSGILFLAHGSMKHHHKEMSCDNTNPTLWEKSVLDAVDGINKKLPFNSDVAFGMWSTSCFDAGIHRLEKKYRDEGKTLDHLIVFPIFISSHSAVIEMQKFIFKKRSDRVIPLPTVSQTSFNGKITYLSAIDYNPFVSLILSERFHHLIHLAKNEGYEKKQMELVLVMHGPVSDSDNEEWLKMGQQYADDVSYLFPVGNSHIVSLRDDAPGDVRDRATEELRNIVSTATLNGRKALVLPLLLSKGGIEEGIIKRLEGLDYVWSGQMILPDSLLGKLLVHRFDGNQK